jgi:hypothetical protein
MRESGTGPPPVAFICGTYLNEYGILQSLRRLGWPGEVVAVKDFREGKTLADLCAPAVGVLGVELREPDDLLRILADRLAEGQEGLVFFCDERFLEASAKARAEGRYPGLGFCVPSPESLRVILDRLALYAHIEARGLAPVPKTLPSDTPEPLTELGCPLILRPRETWVGLRKNPRPAIVGSPEELREAERRYAEAGMERSAWCYQEMLSIEAPDNLSVCGWHGRGERRYLLTHKVLSFPRLMGNGDVVEVLPPDPTLERSAGDILDGLAYEGPFEMEFVRDPGSGTFKVIEINPRFWMQNELVSRGLGDELVRLYAGLPERGGDGPPTQPPRYWVNRIVALFRILRLDPSGLRYLFSRESVALPSVGLTLRYIPVYLARFLRARLRRRSS